MSRSEGPQGGTLIYTGRTRTVGGRDHGLARSSDGQLEVRFSPPHAGRPGTNPEQMLAAGWSVCLAAALDLVARRHGVMLPSNPTIDAEIDLWTGADGLFLRARLDIGLPGVDRDVAQALVEEAHNTCPYSKALGKSIDVTLRLL